jgi:adenosylcobalamin-dependent ribonucleoside-triphosphate reductase
VLLRIASPQNILGDSRTPRRKPCGALREHRHGLRRPNRCTTVQPAGTKSLLTGASPGWYPPKAQRFIRRITFRKNDPVALACLEYGYTIVPSQSDKDEHGRLLDDPFDPRCSEWLVEIPTEVSWANLPGADAVEINNFSALARYDGGELIEAGPVGCDSDKCLLPLAKPEG